MSVVPVKFNDRIQFYEQHISPFTSNATAIGVTTGECSDLQTKTEAARTAFDAREALRQQTEAATVAMRDAIAAMSVAGAAMIKKIRGKADQVGGNSVYTLAEIPPPATPSPVGAPGMPFGFDITLKPNGTLELKWKCENPTGCTNVIYQVYRKVESTGSYEYIGGTGERKFTDLSVPQGVPSIMYQIQATRSTAVGDANEFTVNFGVNSGGAITATVANAKPVKVAA